MGAMVMPEMRRYGYSEELAAGSIGIGATLEKRLQIAPRGFPHWFSFLHSYSPFN
jgi:TRAP-type mannitol/chloroaromatic compound transport system permease large subunit